MSTKSTPVLSVTARAEALVASYAEASGPAKVAVRNEAQAAIHAAIDSLDLEAAQAFKSALDRMVSTKPTAAPVDYAALVAARIATLEHAAQALRNGSVRPAGIPDDADLTGVAALVESARDAAEVAGDKLASEKVARSTGERGSIASAVDRAFEKSDGRNELTIAQVANLGATDDYKPGSGAIAARFFTADGSKGARDGFVGIEATATEPRRIARA